VEVLLERLSARSNTTRYHSTEIHCALLGKFGHVQYQKRRVQLGRGDDESPLIIIMIIILDPEVF
jgi:hypothetical protein